MPTKTGKVSKAGKRGKTTARATLRPQTLMHRPYTETKLDVQHSTQLAQTAVAAIFFEIVWVRKVFQEHGWQNRAYHPNDPNNSYDAYVQGSDFVLPTPNDLHYWHVPNRGEDERVDKLMNCLESCAKEPIEKGYLQKLQLCFHTIDGDLVSEENLIESYSLTFKYENGVTSSQLSRRVKNAQAEEIDTLVLSEGRQRLIDMANKLFECIYKSDRYGRLKQYPLPTQFRLNLLAEYNDSAPDGYQPAYFKPGDAATVALLSLCNSDNEHTMETDYHRVSVGLLLPGSTDSPARRQERTINDTDVAASSSFFLSPPLNREDSTYRSLQHSHSAHLSSDVGDGGTQREAVHQLRNMGFFRVPNAATQDTQRLKQQYPALARQSTEARQEFLRDINAPPYTQYILDHLTRRLMERAESVRGDDLDGPQRTQHEGDIAVNCECGCQGDGGDMIYCAECQQLQHAECYGYLDDEKPSNHICYSCLADLYPEEKPQLVIVANLCIERLALRFLRDKGIAVACQDLADYLGRSLESTDEVIDALAGIGLVQKYNKKPRSSMVKYLGRDETLREEYFRPQRFINNLFALPSVLSTNNFLGPENGRRRIVTPVTASSTLGPEDPVSSTVDASERQLYDDTTQGKPSSQSKCSTPRGVELLHLQNIARHGLNLNGNENGTSATKRFAELGSPVGAVKRVRTSRASPMLFDSSIPK